MMMTLWSAAVALLAATLTYYAWHYYWSPLRKLPGPSSPSWLFGIMPLVFREPPYQPQLRWAKKFGGFVCYRSLGFRLKLLISDPEAIEHILVRNPRNYVKPERIVSQLRHAIGEGLLASEGRTHAVHRAGISPAFHFKNLRGFVPVFAAKANELCDVWLGLGRGDDGLSIVDVPRHMTKLTLDIIGLTAFGYDFDALSMKPSPMYEAYNDLLKSLSLSINTMLRALPGGRYLPTPTNFKIERAVRLIRQQVDTIIRAKRESLAQQQERDEAADDAKRTDLLQLMMMAKDEKTGEPLFDERGLYHQTMTFLLAGHETTSNTLCWVFMLLAQHPEIERRCVEEIVAATKDAGVTADVVQQQLPYTTAVVKETLRLYPAAPLLTRETVKTDRVCGHIVPSGTQVFVSPGVLGRLPSLWHRPDDLVPERWFDDSDVHEQDTSTLRQRGGNSNGDAKEQDAKEERKRLRRAKAFRWLPFNAGERSCIGNKFAMLELVTALAVILPRVQMHLLPKEHARYQDVRPKLSATLKPFPTLLMSVHARQQ